jgi:hypothetical protein
MEYMDMGNHIYNNNFLAGGFIFSFFFLEIILLLLSPAPPQLVEVVEGRKYINRLSLKKKGGALEKIYQSTNR